MTCPDCGTFRFDQTLATIPFSTVNGGIQFPDEEGDGIPNIYDRDDDNDGRADENDRDPFDPAVQ